MDCGPTWGGGSHTRRKGRPADEAAACDMAETRAAARHLGEGVERRAAHHARRAAEREQVGRAAAALLPETYSLYAESQ